MPKRRMKRKPEPSPADKLQTELTANGIEVVPIPENHPKPKKVGRPKYHLKDISPKMVAEILEMARLGMPITSIATCARISFEKFAELRRENPQFDEALKASQEKFVLDNLQRLKRHAEVSPQSAQWLLERVKPQHFSAKSELRVTGSTTSNIVLDVSPDICSRLAEARKVENALEIQTTTIDNQHQPQLLTKPIHHSVSNQITEEALPANEIGQNG